MGTTLIKWEGLLTEKEFDMYIEFISNLDKRRTEVKRIERLQPGDIVYESAYRFGDIDYHPAIVKKTFPEDLYIIILDVSKSRTNPPEQRIENFLTEANMIGDGFTQETLDEDKIIFSEIINKVKNGKW